MLMILLDDEDEGGGGEAGAVIEEVLRVLRNADAEFWAACLRPELAVAAQGLWLQATAAPMSADLPQTPPAQQAVS